MSAPAPTTIEEIVDGLKDHVWVLLRAGHVDAAMSLLADSVEDYLRIVAEVEDAGRHVAPAEDDVDEGTDDDEEGDEEVSAELVVPEATVTVVEVSDLPEEAAPLAVLVEVEDGATWQIPVQTGKNVVTIRERS